MTKYLILAVTVLLTSQTYGQYNPLRPDPIEDGPLQAPVKHPVEVQKDAAVIQAPFQKAVQAPIQKGSAVQKSFAIRAERRLFPLFDRERRLDRRRARLDGI